jgi:hypothetical protein
MSRKTRSEEVRLLSSVHDKTTRQRADPFLYGYVSKPFQPAAHVLRRAERRSDR